MTSSVILSATGTPMVGLGGDVAWRQYQAGDVTVSLQWLDLKPWGGGYAGDDDGPQPVMALFAAHRRVNAGAYVIPQREAHRFATPSGNPTEHLMLAGFKAAITLGFHPDKSTVFRIIDAIINAMPDLIRMPSAAPAEAIAKKALHGIEMSAKLNGRELASTVV